MAHARLGEVEAARDSFDRSVAGMEKNAPGHPILLDFRAEAEAVLRSLALDAGFPADPFARRGADQGPIGEPTQPLGSGGSRPRAVGGDAGLGPVPGNPA